MTGNIRDTSSLLGSRVCHDLISPLGAISNGLELLAMSGMGDSPELKLIDESIQSANARVRFFRVAFGGSSGSQIMARAEILSLLDGIYAGGRLMVRWDSPTDPTRTEVKLGFLSIMCAEAALPLGGEVTIASDRGNWQVQAYGPKIKFEPELWSALNTPISEGIPSSKVQFLLLGEAFTQIGRSAQVGHSDSAVSLRY
jgi:histidine phosphotransferase ChpT